MPVSNPSLNRSVLRDNPDFWGPLIIVLAFSLLSVYGQFKVVSWIITIWVFGSFIVFIIVRALGGEVSYQNLKRNFYNLKFCSSKVYYSQVIGTIGYSLMPLLFAGTLLIIAKKYYYLSLFLKVSIFYQFLKLRAYF
jgi:hypothetical protein